MTIASARAVNQYGPWLYRLFDASDALLYIGVTVRKPAERFNAHSRTRSWWSDVAAVQLTHFPGAWLALAAERSAIKAERPVYNRRSAVLDAP
jgi:hypothetical protein